MPLAAAAPAANLLPRGDTLGFGTSAESWLITASAALLVPSALAAWRLGRHDLLRLLVLAAPFSAVGYITVAYVTNSSWNRGMPAIALAPVAVGILLCWGVALAEESRAVFSAGAGLALLVVFVLLFSSVFGDDSVWQRARAGDARCVRGTAHESGSARPPLDSSAERAPLWVKPGQNVTFLGQAEAYLTTPGTPLTPAAWLFVGPADQAALDYFRRVGKTPDAVFVSDADVALEGGYESAPQRDPMLRWTIANYRRADRAGGFTVFVRR